MAKTAKYPHRVEFRATTEEHRLAEQLASQCDLTVSDLFRVLLRQAATADLVRSRTLIALYQQLGQIRERLAQLNSQQITAQATTLDEAAELVNQARKLIVQILPLI